MLNNPWRKLLFNQTRDGVPWYVLPEDEAVITAGNEDSRLKDEHRIQTQLIPEPYLGRLDAPVIRVLLNPGYTAGEEEEWHAKGTLKRAMKDNFDEADVEFPHVFLNPMFRKSPGGRWWAGRILKRLIEYCGLQKVARNVLALEYFPYHSFRYGGLRVASQAFSRSVLAEAISRQATIIVGRHAKQLENELPELLVYPYLRTNSTQNVVLTERNLPGFEQVAKRVILS